jgi:hypothetical protein
VNLFLGSIIGLILLGTIQSYSDVFIPWSEDRKLTGDDFLGTPGVYPENFGRQKLDDRAYTWGEPKLQSYDFEKVTSVICQYQITKINSIGMFNRNQSWIKEEVSKDPDVLNHEQGHFDILEIYARKMESDLLFKIIKCPTGVFDRPLIDNEIRMLAFDLGSKNQEMHDEYDSEIGKNNSKQSYWDSKFQADLMKYYIEDTDYSGDNKPIPKTTFDTKTSSIDCESGWMPIQKNSNNKLACVTPAVAEKLEEIGWGKMIGIPTNDTNGHKNQV